MTRRDALLTLGAGAVLVGVRSLPSVKAAQAVDPDFVAMYDDAQKERPGTLTSVARIAPANEPGTPLVVHGRLFDSSGAKPIAGAVMFAYHTDREGLYRRPGETGWRLKGWARTTATGEFEFQTIRPAPYPRRDVPAHIHIYVDGPRGHRQPLGILFAGDPLISKAEHDEAQREGRFGSICVVETREGVQHCTLQFRMTGKNVF